MLQSIIILVNMEDAIDLSRVHKMLSYIEENYDQAISVKELERISHYSYRNIQRIFKYACHETIGAYQKRLRLENAFKKILYTKDNLISIALDVGFANQASFSKAFKQQFGISPREAKYQKEPLFAQAKITAIAPDQQLKPDIIYLSPITVYYQSAFINYTHEEVETAWEQFLQHDIPPAGTEFYGIIADEPLIREQLTCRYDTCYVSQTINSQLPSKKIPGGRYAQFAHHGAYETIEDTYGKIYAGWILDTELEFAHTPIIEKYVKHPDNTTDTEELLTYIWLPLK
ncbi:AraC family transcriptional regulator [Chitinophaga nivalis]|uniref:AraC family transcriptional regulator n=1 Tax=Chitinophaga nivalis TaxID=2991709 RepID=A0ABT3IKY0_9BACT|nr:AraC family transcriptional regulator [Chitinophaga nivalis]MCW3465692.1 AraC family transcriptional regulator [Chitinophaga nivalis]MCW3484617.1 AraC family transcriptional regulator [Chitinophaga nivalis]